MATRTVGTLIYKAQHGHTGKVVVEGVTSKEQLTAIRNKLADYVDATCVSQSFTITEGTSVDSLGTGNTDRKLIIKFRDNNTVRARSISIPGVKANNASISVLEKEGERALMSVVSGIVGVLEGATGGDYTALEGDIIQGY